MDFFIFAVAMGALVYGANLVIVEAQRLAYHFRISDFAIGATLVGLGTSLPELAASIKASYSGHGEIAVSNVTGSNLFNISMVLGLVFLLARSLSPSRNLFVKDTFWLLMPVALFFAVLYDGCIGRIDGALLWLIMVAYLIFLARDRTSLTDVPEEESRVAFRWSRTLLWLFVGFLLLAEGADFAIDSAAAIARGLGVTEWLIGFFLVAFGTSLPELVVSVVAARKGSADISIGNIIGSNLSNIAVVVGSAALVHPLTVDLSRSLFDLGAMALTTVLLVFVAFRKLYNPLGGVLLLSMLGVVIVHAANG